MQLDSLISKHWMPQRKKVFSHINRATEAWKRQCQAQIMKVSVNKEHCLMSVKHTSHIFFLHKMVI